MSANEEFIIQDIVVLIKAALKLLARDRIINWLNSPKAAAKRIYELYNFDRTYREDIWEIISLKSNPNLRTKYGKTVKEFTRSIEIAKQLCKEYEGNILGIRSVKPYFHCYSIPETKENGVIHRVYFNPNPIKLHEVIEVIINSFLEYSKVGLVNSDFKFWSTASINTIARCDKVVLYTNTNFFKFIKSKFRIIEGVMNDDVPRLTIKLAKGIGYSRDPSEENIEWLQQKEASFGEFICLVINYYID